MDYGDAWITVYCPVCKKPFSDKKRRNEIKSFICQSEGCSQTEHYFYPGQVKRPEKSVPWSKYWKEKRNCNCATCQGRFT